MRSLTRWSIRSGFVAALVLPIGAPRSDARSSPPPGATRLTILP